MSVEFDESDEEHITAPQLWQELIKHTSGPDSREYATSTGECSYAAIGQAVLWEQLAWVVVCDVLRQGALEVLIKWCPVDKDDTDLIADGVAMRNGMVIPRGHEEEYLARAEYILDNTDFGNLPGEVEQKVALLWGLSPPTA